MGNNKTCNLRCNKCKSQTECTSLEESLSEMRCGLDGGHLNDSCKVNLTLDGKPIFEIKQVVEFGKASKKDESMKYDSFKKDDSSKKDDSKKDDSKKDNKPNATSK